MGIFFISDTHFGHKNIIDFCNRPFDSVEAMDEAMISNWNSVVSPKDTVYHLGDFGRGTTKYLIDTISRLNGNITLLLGNHDSHKWGMTEGALLAFDSVTTYRELKIDKKLIVLFHYPIASWNGSHHGSLHLHGHSHGTVATNGNRLDVGVDGHSPDIPATYTPRSLEEVKLIMEKRDARKDTELSV